MAVRARSITIKKPLKEDILTGRISGTLLRPRKKPIAVGDDLSLRFSDGKGEQPDDFRWHGKCVFTADIYISPPLRRVSINAKKLDDGKALRIARECGFRDLDDFFQFYADRYGYFFRGVLLRWA